MKQLYALALILLLAGCKKSTKEDPYIVVCPEPGFNWLNAKAKEYSPCACKVNFVYGLYNNTPVVEIRIVDPLCNGIDKVYKQDGSVLLSSADQQAYQKYLSEVKDTSVIWTCEKTGSN